MDHLTEEIICSRKSMKANLQFVKCFKMNLSSGGHQVILRKQVLDTPTVAGLLLSFYDGGSVVNHLTNNAYKNLLLCVCVRNSGTDGS